MSMVSVRPIRSEEEFDATMARIGDLFEAPSGTPERDELDVLWALAEAYQREHHNPPVYGDPIEAIVNEMDRRGLRPVDLVPYIGDRARVSDVLSRRRPLSLAMIRRLHRGLGLPLDSLVG